MADFEYFTSTMATIEAANLQRFGCFPINKDTLSYIESVKERFKEEPHSYKYFVQVLVECKKCRIDLGGLITRIRILFEDHPDLAQGFGVLLPDGYDISPLLPMEGNASSTVSRDRQEGN